MLAAAVPTASVAADGLVVVKPVEPLTLTTALGGTYVKLDGSRVAAVAVPPHTGLVLRKALAALRRALRLRERRRLARQDDPHARGDLPRTQRGDRTKPGGQDHPDALLASLLLRVVGESDPQRLEVGAELVELFADDRPPRLRHGCCSVVPAETSPRQAPDSSPRLSISSLNRCRSARTRRASSPAAEPAASAGLSAR